MAGEQEFLLILKLVILVASSELGRETWCAVGSRAETQHERLISTQQKTLHVTSTVTCNVSKLSMNVANLSDEPFIIVVSGYNTLGKSKIPMY